MTDKNTVQANNEIKAKINRVFAEYFNIKSDDKFKIENIKKKQTDFKNILFSRMNNKNIVKYTLKDISEDTLTGLQHRDLNKIKGEFLLKGQDLLVMDVIKSKKELENTCDFKKRLLENNDVILRIKGKVGPAVLVNKDIQGLYYYNDIVKIRVDTDKVLPQYLSLYLNSMLGEYYLKRNTKAKSMNYITIRSLKEIPILAHMLANQWRIIQRYHKLKNIKKEEEIN